MKSIRFSVKGLVSLWVGKRRGGAYDDRERT